MKFFFRISLRSRIYYIPIRFALPHLCFPLFILCHVLPLILHSTPTPPHPIPLCPIPADFWKLQLRFLNFCVNTLLPTPSMEAFSLPCSRIAHVAMCVDYVFATHTLVLTRFQEIFCIVEGGSTHPFRRVRQAIVGSEHFTTTHSPWSNR